MNFASFKNALGQVVQSASSSARDFGATVCGPRSETASLVCHLGCVSKQNLNRRSLGPQKRFVSIHCKGRRQPAASMGAGKSFQQRPRKKARTCT